MLNADMSRIEHLFETWEDFELWCDARGTSPEIGLIIAEMADNLDMADRLWGSPTEAEIDEILNLAGELIQGDDEVLYWGENEYYWDND
jgi:hypothetical protein